MSTYVVGFKLLKHITGKVAITSPCSETKQWRCVISLTAEVRARELSWRQEDYMNFTLALFSLSLLQLSKYTTERVCVYLILNAINIASRPVAWNRAYEKFIRIRIAYITFNQCITFNKWGKIRENTNPAQPAVSIPLHNPGFTTAPPPPPPTTIILPFTPLSAK